MVTYLIIHGILCVAAILFCLYKVRKLEKSVRVLADEIAKQKILFIESGNAITATLKIAFDGIKSLSHAHDRMKKEVKEYTARMNQRAIVNQEQMPNRRTLLNRHTHNEGKEENSE
jgi:hypothetical protein